MKNGQLFRENENLREDNRDLREENSRLRKENRDFALLMKVFNKEKIGALIYQAENMFLRLVKQLAEKERITEQLKAEDQMAWVGAMNSIHARAMEIVNHELIYT